MIGPLRVCITQPSQSLYTDCQSQSCLFSSPLLKHAPSLWKIVSRQSYKFSHQYHHVRLQTSFRMQVAYDQKRLHVCLVSGPRAHWGGSLQPIFWYWLYQPSPSKLADPNMIFRPEVPPVGSTVASAAMPRPSDTAGRRDFFICPPKNGNLAPGPWLQAFVRQPFAPEGH